MEYMIEIKDMNNNVLVNPLHVNADNPTRSVIEPVNRLIRNKKYEQLTGIVKNNEKDVWKLDILINHNTRKLKINKVKL